jgi:hypothetical protein
MRFALYRLFLGVPPQLSARILHVIFSDRGEKDLIVNDGIPPPWTETFKLSRLRRGKTPYMPEDDFKSGVLSSLFWKPLERVGVTGVLFVVQIILARLLLPAD